MADIHSKEQRSRNMAAIRGKGNKSTEIRLVKLFRKHKITGWRRHYRLLPGRPDFVFPKKKIAIFLDGCFWHGCPKCKLKPKTNVKFWYNKIKDNRTRDKRNNKELAIKKWMVLRFWEHQMKSTPLEVLEKIKRHLI